MIIENPELIEVKIKDIVQSKKKKVNSGLVIANNEISNDLEKSKKEWGKGPSMWEGLKRRIYPWERLKRSIEKDGYQPEKYGYILVQEKNTDEGKKWLVINGNHRLKVLQDLHGLEYVIKVRTVNKAPKLNFFEGFLKLPLMHYPALIFFMAYLLGSLLLTAFSIYLVLAIFRNKTDSKVYLTDTHPKKGLGLLYTHIPSVYKILMAIYYNIGYLLSGIILLFFIWNIFYNHWFEFMIMVGVTLILVNIVNVVIKRFKIEADSHTINMEDLLKMRKK